LNLSFWRCLLQKRTHFHENFLENVNCCKNFHENDAKMSKFSRKFAIFALFSLFANMDQTVFVSTLCTADFISLEFLTSKLSWAKRSLGPSKKTPAKWLIMCFPPK
jgi:hypothetical protein